MIPINYHPDGRASLLSICLKKNYRITLRITDLGIIFLASVVAYFGANLAYLGGYGGWVAAILLLNGICLIVAKFTRVFAIATGFLFTTTMSLGFMEIHNWDPPYSDSPIEMFAISTVIIGIFTLPTTLLITIHYISKRSS